MLVDSFKRVLCPVDFSEVSAEALRYAGLLAAGLNGSLVVVYADHANLPPYFTPAQIDVLNLQLAAARHGAGERLAEFIRQTIGESVPFTVQVRDGFPPEQILAAAASMQTGLIVMGTSARTGWNRLWLGSVTERVIRASRIPVLAVKASSSRRLPLRVSRILCPVTASALARRSLQVAAELAGVLGAEVLALHVREDASTAAVPDACGWVESGEHCEVTSLVRHGNPAEQIVRAAQEHEAGLIVIGAEHRAFADTTVVGSTTDRVIRHAPIPVLVSFDAWSVQGGGQ